MFSQHSQSGDENFLIFFFNEPPAGKMICLLFCEGKKIQKTKMAEAAHILVRSPAASGEGFPLFHCFNLLVCVVRSYDHPIIWRDLAIIP